VVAVRPAVPQAAGVHQAVALPVAVLPVAVPRAAERRVACPTLVVAPLAVVRVVSPLPAVPPAALRAEDLVAAAGE
jgi:hypothetical protein